MKFGNKFKSAVIIKLLLITASASVLAATGSTQEFYITPISPIIKEIGKFGLDNTVFTDNSDESKRCNFTIGIEICKMNLTECNETVASSVDDYINKCLHSNCLSKLKVLCKENDLGPGVTFEPPDLIYQNDGLAVWQICLIVVAAHIPFLVILCLLYLHYRKVGKSLRTVIYEHTTLIRCCFWRK